MQFTLTQFADDKLAHLWWIKCHSCDFDIKSLFFFGSVSRCCTLTPPSTITSINDIFTEILGGGDGQSNKKSQKQYRRGKDTEWWRLNSWVHVLVRDGDTANLSSSW